MKSSKVCTKCDKEKPLSAFHTDNDKRDGLRTICRSCRTFSSKKEHSNGVENLNIYLKEHCNHICEICSDVFDREALCFHHTDPTTKEKCLTVGWWRGKNGPPKKTLDEADKCVVLCLNCHAYEHKALNEGWSYLNEEPIDTGHRNDSPTDNEPEQGSHDRDDGSAD